MTGQTVLNYSISGFYVTRTLIEPWNELSPTIFCVPHLDGSAYGIPVSSSRFSLKTFFTLYASENIFQDLMEKVGWDEWQPPYIVFRFLEACRLMTSLGALRLTPSPSSDFHFKTSVRRQFHQIHVERQYWTIEVEENRKAFRFNGVEKILPPLKTSLMLTQATSTLDHVLIISWIIWLQNVEPFCIIKVLLN